MRLLAEFYLQNLTAETSNSRRLPPEHLGIIYDSLLSSESSREHVRLTIDGHDPIDSELEFNETELIEGEFEFLSFDRQGELQSQPVSFSLPINSNSEITFARYIRDASVIVPCKVSLGGYTPEFTIGPSVHICANELRVMSESLKVGERTKQRTNNRWPDEEYNSVILEAVKFNASPALRLTVYNDDDFLVNWTGAEHYPWTQFRVERTYEDMDDESLHKAYMRFKRIATAFRSQGRGSLARTKFKIENQRVLQGPLGRALLEQLVSDGILILGDNGSRYFWNSERANSKLGVSWENLRKGERTELLQGYLSHFVQQNSYLF